MNEKMIKTTKAVDKVLKIVQSLLSAGAIVCAIFIVLVAILGEKMFSTSGTLSVELGWVDVKLLDSAALAPESLKFFVIATLLTATVMIVVAWVIVKFARNILAPMKDGEVFATGISKKVNKLALATLIGGLVMEFTQSIGVLLQFKQIDITSILNPSVVDSFEINYSMDFKFVFVAAIIYLLGFVFNYGEQLQKDADETL